MINPKFKKQKKSKKFKNTENSHYWTSFSFDQRYRRVKDTGGSKILTTNIKSPCKSSHNCAFWQSRAVNANSWLRLCPLIISQHVNDKVSREKQNDIYILDWYVLDWRKIKVCLTRKLDRSQMSIPFFTVCIVSRPLFSPVLVYFLFILFLLPHGHHGAQTNSYKNKEINIGVIIDVNSRIGKEEQTAMEIAAQNEAPKSRSVSLQFLDSNRDPQQVASAGELICFTTFFFFCCCGCCCLTCLCMLEIW